MRPSEGLLAAVAAEAGRLAEVKGAHRYDAAMIRSYLSGLEQRFALGGRIQPAALLDAAATMVALLGTHGLPRVAAADLATGPRSVPPPALPTSQPRAAEPVRLVPRTHADFTHRQED